MNYRECYWVRLYDLSYTVCLYAMLPSGLVVTRKPPQPQGGLANLAFGLLMSIGRIGMGPSIRLGLPIMWRVIQEDKRYMRFAP
ncbi:hypothetical protein F5X98DRAFT_344246 [Xylaria grammica]|nr:hypothetical protein F5X98DRAFT_344246 [Xylaria grammica]